MYLDDGNLELGVLEDVVEAEAPLLLHRATLQLLLHVGNADVRFDLIW